MEILLFALSSLGLLVSLYALHKIRLIHISTFQIEAASITAARESTQLYAQVQAYMDLLRLVEPVRPLPSLRGWAASPDFLLRIAGHARDSAPQRVLECSSGASTLVLARCLQLNGSGHVVSLEHDPAFAEQTRSSLRMHGLADWATVIDAPLAANPATGTPWYSLDGLTDDHRAFDMLVIDGPPSMVSPLARHPALPVLSSRLSVDCVVFLDDADRAEERDTLQRWSSEFSEFQQELLQCEKGCARLQRINLDADD